MLRRSAQQITFRIPGGEIDAFASFAAEKGYSVSELGRLLVRRVIRGSIRIPSRKEPEYALALVAEAVEGLRKAP